MAPFYNAVVVPLRFVGGRRHRKQAVASLGLKRGDVVLDLGCGTGLNFPFLYDAVGDEGHIIGVDLTPEMLAQARARVSAAGFANVELVEADLSTYVIPEHISAAIATFVLEAVPEYDSVVRSIAEALPPGGRLASYGLKHPERWPAWVLSVGVWLTKPFGVSRDYESFRPWESIRRHLVEIDFREFLLGSAYLSVGESR